MFDSGERQQKHRHYPISSYAFNCKKALLVFLGLDLDVFRFKKSALLYGFVMDSPIDVSILRLSVRLSRSTLLQ